MPAIVLPTLRADLAVNGDFTDTGAPASCPVAAYGGDADPCSCRRDGVGGVPHPAPVMRGPR
jgi:surfactin synthase thioesterase subunit